MNEDELKEKVDEYFEKYMMVSFDKFLENCDELSDICKNLIKKNVELEEKVERLNNIINEALGIANERFNYYSHYKSNNEEHLEDWENIFNVLLRRDN